MTNPKFELPDFAQAERLLQELFEEVEKQENPLSGGQNLGIGTGIIKDLQDTKVSFGNPKNELIRLTEDTFKETGIELDNIIKKQIKNDYDFYFLSLNVNLRPKPGARFWRLNCYLEFSKETTIIYRMFPSDEWQSILKAGVGMDIGINTNLNWGAGIEDSIIKEVLPSFPANLKANIESKNELKAFVVLPDFKYDLGRPAIGATGEGSNWCQWTVQNEEIQKIGTAKFGMIFKVPKKTKFITLTGITWADININWFTDHISDIVFSRLPEKIQELLGLDKEELAEKFVISNSNGEEWNNLKLPQ